MRSIEGRTRAWPGRPTVLALAAAAAVGLSACGSVEPVAPHEQPITDPTQLYMGLTFNERAVNLSTAPGYETVQLTATPRDALGNPMAGLPSPTYRVVDTTKVLVSEDGLVTAVGTVAVPGTPVIATLTLGPVTQADTAMIVVRDLPAPPVLDELAIDPVAPDSAVWPISFGGGFGQTAALLEDALGVAAELSPRLTPRAVDAADSPISGLAYHFTSLDSAVATVKRESGIVTLLRPGQVRVVARTMAYGVVKADTLSVRVTPPYTWDILFRTIPSGETDFFLNNTTVAVNEVRIAPYGFVTWFNYTGDTVDVTFDDPTNVGLPPPALCEYLDGGLEPGHCLAGNVLMAGNPDPTDGFSFFFTMQVRQFRVPGVYAYHSVRTGRTGKIVVVADQD